MSTLIARSIRLSLLGVAFCSGLLIDVSAYANNIGELPGYLITKKNIGTILAPSQFAKKLISQMHWQQLPIYNSNDILMNNVIVINLAEYTNGEIIDLAKQAVRLGKVVILDSTEVTNTEKVVTVSSQVIGVGLADPIVIVRSKNKTPEYKSISLSPSIDLNESSLLSTDEISSIKIDKLVGEVKKITQHWDSESTRKHSSKKNKKHNRLSITNNDDSTRYKPDITIPIEFRHVGFKCRVGKEFDGNGWSNTGNWHGTIEDACDGQASVSLFYTLDFVRSVTYSGGGDHNADNAKYLRITLNPASGGGSGWHLVNQPTHKHTWFESYTNRLTWFGPIAMDYGVEVTTSDQDVHLYSSTPNNKGKESEIREVTGFTVGVEAGGKADIGDKGPTVGVDVKGSFSYSSQRWVTYKTYEYTIENQSAAGLTDKAKWIWDRKFNEYSENWRTNSTCALWCDDWFFKDSAFTAAAYANYKPGFSATFRAPAAKEGESLFTISNQMTVAALGGRVQYMGFMQGYTPWSYSGTKYTFHKKFKVNWSAPVFEPETNVSLEAFRFASNEGICLDVAYGSIANGAKVIGYPCKYSNNQLWGLDNFQRYKSRVAKDRCLTAENDNSLTVRQCTATSKQKWRWEADKLANELGKYVSIINGKVIMSDNRDDYNDWRSYVRNIGVDKVLTVY